MHVRLGIVLAVLVAAAAAPASGADTPASVRVVTCEPWEEGAGGQVVYSARMNSVPGSSRMALRIRLLERYGGGPFEPVSAEKLGTWRKSRVGATTFRYKQRVRGLHRAAVYRALVNYRWLDAGGQVLQHARRHSQTCSQGDVLPNLQVASVETHPGEVEDTAIYKATVVNPGEATAHDVGVLLRVDGEVVDEAETIDVLAPNEEHTVTFHGPVCRHKLRVVVDPKELIAETREQDNVLSPTCL